jgi:hypothetical protein
VPRNLRYGDGQRGGSGKKLEERPELEWWFRIAAHLGMSVARAQKEISSLEFSYWLAYTKKNMLDQDSWEQTALMCSVAANVAGNKTKPIDFLPTQEKKQEQTAKEMAAVMEGLFGGS